MSIQTLFMKSIKFSPSLLDAMESTVLGRYVSFLASCLPFPKDRKLVLLGNVCPFFLSSIHVNSQIVLHLKPNKNQTKPTEKVEETMVMMAVVNVFLSWRRQKVREVNTMWRRIQHEKSPLVSFLPIWHKLFCLWVS